MKRRIIAMITIIVTSILIYLVWTGKFLQTSFGEDINMITEATLNKYNNYFMSEEEQGTIVQFNIKTKVEYQSDEHLPIKKNATIVNFGQIDGKFPKDAKILAKEEKEEISKQYDSETGVLTIETNDPNETQEYTIIADYETFMKEKVEREIKVEVIGEAIIESEEQDEERQISKRQEYKNTVTEDIGDLTSISCDTQEINLGAIKSNKINGTNYVTEYEQKEEVIVSKKEAQETLEIKENNLFLAVDENVELPNDKNIIYKSTKVDSFDLKNLLGEEGKIDILDAEENLIATIDKDTQEVNYENELESVILRTTNIQKEGFLRISHKKEIRKVPEEVKNVGVKTKINDSYESVNLLKQPETKVDIKISQENWSNSQQNEVTFDVLLDASTMKNNLFKNPNFRIELPKQVEKVILGSSSIIYGNGLELQEPSVEKNENGNFVIVANVDGQQTEYQEGDLGLITDVRIIATIVLNQEFESTEEKIKFDYSNHYTIDGSIEQGTKEITVNLENYKQPKQEMLEEQEDKGTYKAARQLTAEDNNLKLEVAPTKGETTLTDNDVVYEGEYIKYNIKVTNTSDKDIDNAKIVATIPEGVTYGELESNFYEYRGDYKYHFDEECRTKTIELGSIKPGKTVSTYYEVKVNDLAEGENEKQILSTINSYIGEKIVQTYEVINIIQPAEIQLFMGTLIDYNLDYDYHLKIVSDKDNGEITVRLHLQEGLTVYNVTEIENSDTTGYTVYNTNQFNYLGEPVNNINLKVLEDNVVEATLRIGYYYGFMTRIDNEKIDRPENAVEGEVLTYAETSVNGKNYTSNENRVKLAFQNVEISMASPTEGEKVAYEEEIEYDITIKNVGRHNVNLENWIDNVVVDVTDFIPENVDPISVTYNNWTVETKKETNEETGETEIASYEFVKNENITQNIEGRLVDKDGNEIPNVKIKLLIPTQESVTLKVKAKAGLVYTETNVENYATVSGKEINTKTTNTITHTILPYNIEEPDVDLDNPEERASISGVAWLDENEDGNRSEIEPLLSGITVMLVETNNLSEVKQSVTTNEQGEYQFTDLEKGNYLVVFQYDTNVYRLTEYQKGGVNSSKNSDAINKTIIVNNNQVNVGMTDIITTENAIRNIDIGLIKNKYCDFKVEKFINKVTVKTKNGTKQYTHGNKTIAKAEIKAKEIEGATVTIEYKIVITNQGEIAGTVGKITDFLPQGLEFDAKQNRDWVKNKSGDITNTTIAKKKIEAGESTELTLIATKKMTANDTGTFKNKVRIDGISSISGTNDREEKNNEAVADIIISISTGAIVYISITILGLGILCTLAIYLYKKGKIHLKKIGKIAILIIISSITMLSLTSNVLAAYTDSQYFKWYQQHCFYGGPTGEGRCGNNKNEAYNGTYVYSGENYGKDYIVPTGQPTTTGDFTLGGEGTVVQKREIFGNTHNIYGPFNFSCSIEATYTCGVWGKDGASINGWGITDSEGRGINLSGKGGNFYINVPKSIDIGVTKVTLWAKGQITATQSGINMIQPLYLYTGSWGPKPPQPVYTHEYIPGGEGTSQEVIEKTLGLTWTIDASIPSQPSNPNNPNNPPPTSSTGGKQDADDPRVKLKGVKIRATCYEPATEDYPGFSYNQVKTTDSRGRISLPAGHRYSLTETSNPNYGYTDSVGKRTTANGSSFTLNNTKQTGNLKIEKRDPDSKQGLADISFKLKDSSGKYVIAKDTSGASKKRVVGKILLGGMSTTTSSSSATEFVTDSSGNVEIYNILIGTYQVIETSVGSNSDYYEIDDNYISWSGNKGTGTGRTATINVTRQKSYETNSTTSNKNNTLRVYNKRKYVKYSGFVWENKPWEENKLTKNNLLYQENQRDRNDRTLKDITVQLKDASGKVLQEKTTDQQGSYLFEKVLIDSISRYFIEFQYNGIRYQNILATTNHEKGSKAEEGTNRATYNQEYSTITKGKSNAFELTYETSDYTSKLLYRKDGNKSKYNYGYSENVSSGDPVSGVDEQFVIRANTIYSYNGYLDRIHNAYSIRASAIEEIKNINLGIEKREKADLSLVKDINKVKVSINNADHIYRYADRFNSSLYGDNGSQGKNPYDMEPQVRFGSKYGSMSYTRSLYPSDVYYKDPTNKQDADGIKENELRVKITYQIGIKNATSLKTVVNEIEDYYDIKFYNVKGKVKVGRQIDEQGEVIPESQLSYDIVNSGYNDYHKIHIKNMELAINGNSQESIYVQIEVQQDNIKNILEGSVGSDKLDNIAEIASYSCKGENDTPYAAIDQDSAPGNINIKDQKTYEDDTDKAPGIKLMLQEERKSDGIVYIDNPIETGGFNANVVNQGKIRQGSGIYENGEKPVQGVTVQLINPTTGQVVLIHDKNERDKTKAWKPATTVTDANGYYKFQGFIPDEYQTLYTWGGQTYTNRNGQLEKIRVQDYKGTIFQENAHQGLEWYKNQVGTRYTDAVDKYNERLAIDKQASMTTNANREVIRNYVGKMELEDGRKEDLITQLHSNTPTYRVNVEYVNGVTYGSEKLPENYVRNIDFGIIERAKQTLKLSKEINRIRLVLANGNVLIDSKIGPDKKIESHVKYATYIPKTIVNNGHIKLEVDNELLYSATLKIEYGFTVDNISELEYLNQDYYVHGSGHGEINSSLVALDARTIIDYLDNSLAGSLDENQGWLSYTDQEKLNLIEQDGLLTEKLRETLTKTKVVAHTANLSKPLQPVGTSRHQGILNTFKTLPSSLDEENSIFDNNAEIIKIIKTGGSTITTTPGNYVPSEGVKEVDEAESETVTIIPPTGLSINYIAYTLLGISSLGIMITGIVLIKKYVLK